MSARQPGYSATPKIHSRTTMTASTPQQPGIVQTTEYAIEQALIQLDYLRLRFTTQFPGDTTEQQFYRERTLDHFAPGANAGWTSGFWPGLLWLAYEVSGQPRYREAAASYLPGFRQRLAGRIDVDHHDLGFLYIPTCIAAFRLTGDLEAKQTALAAADCLMERYLPAAGIIQAWGDLHDPRQRGRIIIDCLMNLPLLHWASEMSGDQRYRDAAVSHLERSQRYLVRGDASSFHTFHFDPLSGAALYGSTHQGHSDESSWARGQAWGIYGFALNHRHAPELGLLDTAMRQADYFLAHLPADRIAYWDLAFSDGSGEPRDSSASAIAVCGLLELAGQIPDGARRQHYQAEAASILEALWSGCAGKLPASSGLLRHGVYHKRGDQGIDEANLWGDYYYLEALARIHVGWHPYC
jgi:unsaturated chondroitin disaccharide hydrolase